MGELSEIKKMVTDGTIVQIYSKIDWIYNK